MQFSLDLRMQNYTYINFLSLSSNVYSLNISPGVNDENLLKELLEIWRNITQLKY